MAQVSGFFVTSLFDDIITNNKTNKDHIITLVFDEFKSSDPTEIKNAKRRLENSIDYEVSLDYDKKGFVNMVTVETLVKEEEKETIINDFEIRTFPMNTRNYPYYSFYNMKILICDLASKVSWLRGSVLFILLIEAVTFYVL